MEKLHKEVINAMKRIYKEGTQIELVHMDDKQAPPSGTKGIVQNVDDVGTIHVKWDTGSTLGLVPGVDKWIQVGGE